MEDSLEWAMTSLDGFPGQGRASLAKDFLEGRQVELEGLTGPWSAWAARQEFPRPSTMASTLS